MFFKIRCDNCQIFKNVYFEKDLQMAGFWSWNIIIPNLLWRMYFMCILLSDCTNTIVTKLKNKSLNQIARMVLRII